MSDIIRLYARGVVAGLTYLLLAVIVGAGCAAPAKTPLQADSQDMLLSRQRFDTPGAHIYASSSTAAAEAEHDLQTAVRDFEKATRLTAGKGLVVVSDKQDPPYSSDRMLVYRLVSQEEAARYRPAATQPVTQEKLDKVGEKIGQEVLHKMFLARCGNMAPAEARTLFELHNRPAGSAQWVIMAPTSGFVQQVAREILQAAMSQKDMPLMGKAILAPLGPLFEASARRQTPINRQVAFYVALVQHDPRLDEATRAKLITAYCQRKQRLSRQQDNGLLTALEEARRKAAAATQPTGS